MRLPWQKKASETQAEVPEEVKEYYEAGKRERKGVAWLLAFFTLVLTILIVFGAFLGGRWVYRKIAHRGDEAATVSTQDEGSNQTEENNESSPSDNSGEEATPAPSPIPAAPSQSTPTTPSAPTTQSTNLANTGPGDTVAIFAVATIAGTVLYQVKLRRQTH